MHQIHLVHLLALSLFMTACGGGGETPPNANPVADNPDNNGGGGGNGDGDANGDGDDDGNGNNGGGNNLDNRLATLIAANNLRGDARFNRTLPDIQDPLPQLGRALFFSKSLGGDFDAACVACHHPTLGGADGLSLPVGVGALAPDHLGPGRTDADGLHNVPRHSPSVFNVGLMDRSLFWDSRVESFGSEEFANGSVSAIRTPDVAIDNADSGAGANLVAAQGRFPVTSSDEMRGIEFAAGESNGAVRTHIAARLGNYGSGTGVPTTNGWLAEHLSTPPRNRAQSMTQEIIIVEHEEKITQVLDDYPRQAVFSTHWLADGTEAEQIIRARSPTLVILDLMLLGRDGMSICQALRSDSDLPIIMLTARIDEIDRLLGLQAGADDHVCKPFSPRKVVARVHTILRRTNAAGAVKPNNKQMTYRQLRLDAAARTAQIGDRALKLTPVEFALLQTLLQQPGRVYARDDLMARAYSDNRVAAPRTIDSHMKNLRAKVLAVDPDADLIHSIYAVGYKLE